MKRDIERKKKMKRSERLKSFVAQDLLSIDGDEVFGNY
jgi:hypothetical protein